MLVWMTSFNYQDDHTFSTAKHDKEWFREGSENDSSEALHLDPLQTQIESDLSQKALVSAYDQHGLQLELMALNNVSIF